MAIIVEFSGGFRDGERASTDSEDPDEADLAESSYILASHGTVGGKFRGPSDLARHILRTEGREAFVRYGFGANHFYKIVSRTVDDEDVVLRFESCGPDD
jgi:hypothetical protein